MITKAHARRMRTAALALAALTALSAPRVRADSTVTIALTGDAAPTTGGGNNGSFTSFGGVLNLNRSGQLAFSAGTDATGSESGIFRGGISSIPLAIVRKGDAAPNTSGGNQGSFTAFGLIHCMNEFGEVAFDADIDTAASDEGIFLRGGALFRLVALAREGNTAPTRTGTTDGTIAYVGGAVVNGSGTVAFTAEVTVAAGSESGVFRGGSNATLQAIAREGDSAPTTSGGTSGTFTFVNIPQVNDVGQVAFLGQTTTVGSESGVFRGSSGTLLQAIARKGDSAPTSSGGANGTFTSFPDIFLSNPGQVGFKANTSAAGSASGIFRGSSFSTLKAIVREGDAAPSSSGGTSGTFTSFGTVHMNDAGQFAFWGETSAVGSEHGIFRGSLATNLQAIARRGDASPDGNGTFLYFPDGSALSETGTVAFSADLGGTAGGTTDDHALYLGDGQETVLIAREGQALAGSTITWIGFSASGATPINAHGQVAYRAILANGRSGIFVFVPETLRWRSESSGGWDSYGNWTLTLKPGAAHDVYIQPQYGAFIAGPASAGAARSLALGSRTSGITTLDLGGGDLAVTGSITIQSLGAIAHRAGTLSADSVAIQGSYTQSAGASLNADSVSNAGWASLAGATAVDAAFVNRATLTLDNATITGGGSFTNDFGAVLTARGTIAMRLVNNGSLFLTGLLATDSLDNSGSIEISSARSLVVTSATSTNTGTINLSGGALTGAGRITNSGIIQGSGAIACLLSNSAGELRIPDYGSLNIIQGFISSGTINLQGPSSVLIGGSITNNGTIAGQGRIANSIANSGVIHALGGQLTLAGAVMSNTSTGLIRVDGGAGVQVVQGLPTNAGTIYVGGGSFENAGTLTNTGRLSGYGTFSSSSWTNGGLMTFAGGASAIHGSVTNNPGRTISVKYDPAVFTGPVTNNGIFEVVETTVTLAGGFTGAPISGMVLSAGLGEAGSIGGTGSTTVGSAASLIADSIRQNTLSIAGRVNLQPNGGASVVDVLSILGSGTLDVSNNSLAVTSGDLETITSQIGLGRNGNGEGQWMGKGITSSTATGNWLKGLAVGFNRRSDGTKVDPALADSAIMVKYTWNGDMYMDGVVDGRDYHQMDAGFLGRLSGYGNGDLDYNGVVDGNDYFLIDLAYLGQTPNVVGSAPGSTLVAVPEPAMFGAALIGLMLARRRRGRNRVA